MKISERLLEVVRALYWNLGSDSAQTIIIDWLGLEGDVQNGRDMKGQATNITVNRQTLDDLVKLGLIEVEHKAGPSPTSIWSNHYSIVRLRPDALEVDGLITNNGTGLQDSARYASVTIDIFEFAKMTEEYFSLEEHQDLCLRLGLDYQSVVPANATKLVSAQAIVSQMRREMRLMELWRVAAQERPRYDWSLLLRG